MRKSLKEMVEKPMKIALYEEIDGSFQTLDEVDGYLARSNNYVRLTNLVEVQFKARADADLVPEAIEKLRAQIGDIRAEAMEKVNHLEDQVAKLLAITDQSDD